MANNKAPLGRRLVALGVGVLASVIALAVAACAVGAVAGWVWRWLCFGFAGVQP